jgi:hypothetical protein
MISAQQCRVCSADCEARAKGAGISAERAAILSEMSKSWALLATQAEQYEALEKKEACIALKPA